jgi:ribosomal protein S27AE
MNDVEQRLAYETRRFLTLAARAGLSVGKRAPAPARSAPAPGPPDLDLPNGQSKNTQWLPAGWKAGLSPVARRTKAALDAAAPVSRACPHCGAPPAYLMSGYIDNYPLWWCGQCAAVRSRRW